MPLKNGDSVGAYFQPDNKKSSLRSPQITSAGGAVEKREPSCTVGGNASWYNDYGEQYQLTFPPAVQEGSLVSTPPPAFVICGLIKDGHSDWCEVVSHGSFDLHFSYNQRC